MERRKKNQHVCGRGGGEAPLLLLPSSEARGRPVERAKGEEEKKASTMTGRAK